MPNGTIILLQHTKDKYDVLYASNSDIKGDINRSKFEKIYDRSILPQLSKGKNSYGSSLAMTTNFIDATNLFLFVSEQTGVEWSLIGFESQFYRKGQTGFILRTSHNPISVRTPNQ